MSGLPSVFISYSREDEEWKRLLATHLRLFERQRVFKLWDDTKIKPGQDRSREIRRAMNAASLAVLGLSADYLDAKEEEWSHLLRRRSQGRLQVIPVLLRSVDCEAVDWLRDLQILPRDGHAISSGTDVDADADAMVIAREIARILCDLPSPKGAAGPISRAKMPPTGPDLFGRKRELKRLDEAWKSEHIHVVSLVAWGGVGKSALVNHWLESMAKDDYRGARRVFCWSFSATSADNFIEAALREFGDADPAAGTAEDKGGRLARWVRRERTLLVLDGLEPLQHPPGPDGGGLKSQALASLLKELAAANPGMCVITTRHPLTDLQLQAGSTAPTIHLGHLSDAAGADLLRALGVEGPEEELRKASKECRGHCLTLNLLGTYIRRVFNGDVRRRNELRSSPRVSFEAQRMMASYEEWLGEGPELAALRLVGLFDGPAKPASIAALREKPPIEGLTDPLVGLEEEQWLEALAHLGEARLLAEDPSGDLDAHPLVREYFAEQLRTKHPEAWRKGHCRLYEHFKKESVPHPDTLEEMDPLLAAVAHGCRAGKHQEALDEVYWERISRRHENRLSNKLGALDAHVAALSNFLVGSSEKTVDTIDRHSQAFVLARFGLALRLQGFLDKAEKHIQAGREISAKIPRYKNAVSGTVNACRHLSQVYSAMGALDRALQLAEEAVDLSSEGTGLYEQVAARTTLGDVHHQRGEWEDAKKEFAEAKRMRAASGRPHLYHLAGYRYCELLIGLREFDQVIEQTEATRSWEQDYILGAGLNHLSRAQALTGKAHYEAAKTEMTAALQDLRAAGQQQFIVAGHLAHAALLRLEKDLAAAEEALDKATSIATSTGMKLHEVDCHLERCRIRLARGETERARESLETARTAIERLLYYRRREELTQLDRQLSRD